VSNNPVIKLNEAYLEFLDGKLSRRSLAARAAALGLSAASVATFMRGVPASAQDASPVAATSEDMSFQSITFDEYKAQLMQAFPFEEPANTGGSVINGDSSSLTTTNLMVSSDAPTNPVLALVYETLVGSSPIDGQYVPLLAERWEIAPDGRTYTFYLRQDVTWHDGTPFTADDVVFSMEAQADPATTSAYTTSFNATVESFSKVDDYTVQVVAPAVLAQVVFLGNSYCPIVAKHIWESVPHADWATDPGSTGEDPSRVIGTGMFKFVELNSGDGLARFARNENYWDTAPVIDEFIFQVWPDDISAVEALRAGDVDFYENVPPSDTQALIDEDHLDVALYDTFSFSFYAYQMDFERFNLFEDVRTRQALAYAIDRQSIVDNIMLGYAEVAQGSQPTLSIAYAPDEIRTQYVFDPEKAKSLLAEAGWTDSDGDGVLDKDGQKLSFRMTYGTGSATTDQIVAYLQEAWATVGAEMVPDGVDFSDALLPIITGPAPSHDYETILLGFNWDATADQSAMFSTDSYVGGFNFMKYSNPEVDRLNEEANQTIDPAERRRLLVESANLVNDDLPLNVMLFRKDRTGYNVRMHNYFPNALGGIFWPLQYVWVDA
jgi:peptide/nickel transport system substrate-binding protein